MAFHIHSAKKELQQSILLNIGFAVFEGIFGVIANSNALISDALHDLTDSVSLSFAWYSQIQAKKAPTKKYTFGHLRFTVFAAALNALILLAVSGFIFWSAYQRFLNPQPVRGWVVFIVAIVGIAVNAAVVQKLRHHKEDISARSAMWHMLEDMFGWVAFLIGGVVMIFSDFTWIDPLLSVLVGAFVLYGAFNILTETFRIFSEGVPKGIDLDEVAKSVKRVKEVQGVHDVHIWTLGAGVKTLSCHIRLPEMQLSQARHVIDKIEKMLLKKYDIQHATIEVETAARTCPPGKKCD
ncbi:cation diffusion facilitator family transporter [Patescibacteria group bacterium]